MDKDKRRKKIEQDRVKNAGKKRKLEKKKKNTKRPDIGTSRALKIVGKDSKKKKD